MCYNLAFAQYTTIVKSAEENNKPEEYIEYYDSGKVLLKSFKDKDGKINGKTTVYYENGNKNGEGMLENGKQQGEWKYYLENGELVSSTETYLNGVLHGSYKEYYENLSYKKTGQYTNGKKEGIWRSFFENDQKRYEYYKDDNVYRVEHFYANSNITMFEGDITNGIGQMVKYTKAEKKESEGKIDISKEIKLGDWKYYDKNGNLTKTETYKEGKVISTKTIEDNDWDDLSFGPGTLSKEEINAAFNIKEKDPELIKEVQQEYIKDIENKYSNFGDNNTTIDYLFIFNHTDDSGSLLIRTEYMQDKVYFEGKYVYDISFGIDLLLKNVNSVYEEGDVIGFNMNSKGYLMKVKPQGEEWTKHYTKTGDFKITVYDDELRKEMLERFEYLVEHPYMTR